MKPPLFLAFLCILILLTHTAQAVTVGNSVFSASLDPGDTAVFSMSLNPDTIAEQGLGLTISTGGECASWLKTTPAGTVTVTPGTQVNAQIAVPAGTYGGSYRCDIMYTSPEINRGDMKMRAAISVPVSLTISGEPAPTTVPTTITTVLTEAPTQAPEMKAPVQETPATVQTQETPGQWSMPLTGVAVLVVGILVFCIVLVYDTRRGRKRT